MPESMDEMKQTEPLLLSCVLFDVIGDAACKPRIPPLRFCVFKSVLSLRSHVSPGKVYLLVTRKDKKRRRKVDSAKVMLVPSLCPHGVQDCGVRRPHYESIGVFSLGPAGSAAPSPTSAKSLRRPVERSELQCFLTRQADLKSHSGAIAVTFVNPCDYIMQS